jgi:hypothetical protein
MINLICSNGLMVSAYQATGPKPIVSPQDAQAAGVSK